MCVFFFVTLKTAYAMRISDWSSDVCSSDLGEALNPDRGRGISCEAHAGSDREPDQGQSDRGQGGACLGGGGARRLSAGPDRGQIGRASCRERECQYVLISVAAEHLKTNTNIRHTGIICTYIPDYIYN